MRLQEIKPQLVIVMGGAGSGKNYFIEHDPTYSSYHLVDVDEIKKHGDLAAAIMQVKPMLQAAFERGENVVHPTTGSNLKGQENKIALARQYDYTVTLILIDTPPEVAVDQVRQRVRKGGHSVQIDNIVTTNKKARENFNTLSKIVDNSKVI
jgi:predicted ABC-type ATPase